MILNAVQNHFCFRIIASEGDRVQRLMELHNLDEKKAELILFDDQQKQNEVQLIATRKVLMRLFSNATNNINQMSKRLNRNLFVSEDEFLQLINSLDELKKEVARVGNLKNN